MRAPRRLPFSGRFPRVNVRRTWNLDGTPAWEFRFTSTPLVPVPKAPRPAVEAPRGPVHFVSSRGVEIGADTLRVEQFHHRLRNPPGGFGGRFDDQLESPEAAPVLIALAADPEDQATQYRVAARLAALHTWFREVPVLDISAARITGSGIGRSLDGVFVWRAEGPDPVTYLVAPDSGTRDLLAADRDLVQALIRAACPRPDDVLGELESSLREAITRLGVVARPKATRTGPTPTAQLVLRVEPERSAPARAQEPAEADRQKTESERALSQELAELAKKVGSASVRKPGAAAVRRELEAG